MEDITSIRKEIRKRVLAERTGLAAEAVRDGSAAVLEQVRAAGIVSAGAVCHVYYPIRNEVDTRPLIEWLWAAGHTVVMPRTVWESHSLRNTAITDFNQLESTTFGMREPRLNLPIHTGAIDIVFVPGVAFDEEKNRLGYGAGFYDHFLAQTSARKIALAFACQMVPHIPALDHDIRMDAVVTEGRIVY